MPAHAVEGHTQTSSLDRAHLLYGNIADLEPRSAVSHYFIEVKAASGARAIRLSHLSRLQLTFKARPVARSDLHHTEVRRLHRQGSPRPRRHKQVYLVFQSVWIADGRQLQNRYVDPPCEAQPWRVGGSE